MNGSRSLVNVSSYSVTSDSTAQGDPPNTRFGNRKDLFSIFRRPKSRHESIGKPWTNFKGFKSQNEPKMKVSGSEDSSVEIC